MHALIKANIYTLVGPCVQRNMKDIILLKIYRLLYSKDPFLKMILYGMIVYVSFINSENTHQDVGVAFVFYIEWHYKIDIYKASEENNMSSAWSETKIGYFVFWHTWYLNHKKMDLYVSPILAEFYLYFIRQFWF